MESNIVVQQDAGEGLSLMAYAKNLDDKFRFCQMLLQSQMVPTSYKSAQAVLTVILMGQEFGFSPLKSLDLFDYIEGRASMRAVGLAGLLVKNGGLIEIVEETPQKCTLKASRKSNGWTGTFTYSMEMAQKAGLASKHNWLKHPHAMLYARCISTLARRGWPDIVAGLPPTVEELQDEAAANEPAPQIAPAPKAVEPPKQSVWWYDMAQVPSEEKPQLTDYLLGYETAGTAYYDSNKNLWASSMRIGALNDYEVKTDGTFEKPDAKKEALKKKALALQKSMQGQAVKAKDELTADFSKEA